MLSFLPLFVNDGIDPITNVGLGPASSVNGSGLTMVIGISNTAPYNVDLCFQIIELQRHYKFISPNIPISLHVLCLPYLALRHHMPVHKLNVLLVVEL